MGNSSRQLEALMQRQKQAEERFGNVYAQYVDQRAFMAPFLVRYRRDILVHQEALLAVQRDIADLRVQLGDRNAREPGSVESTLTQLGEVDMSVQAQYQRAWSGGNRGVNATGPEAPPPEVVATFVTIAAKAHPELSSSPAEKGRRRVMIEHANAALLRRDLPELRRILGTLEERDSSAVAIYDDVAVLNRIRDHIFNLETLTARFEAYVFELKHGDPARVLAESNRLKSEGRDFMRELASTLKEEVDQARAELARLRLQRPGSLAR